MRFDLRSPLSRACSSYLFWIIVSGLAIRLVLGLFFTFPYDSGNWAKIAETVISGETLYDRPDNSYAPIWGYLLAFLSKIYLSFGGSSLANQFDEFLFLDGFRVSYYNSVMIEPGFAMLLKVVLFLFDLAVAFVIRTIVMEMCHDERKANIAFTLWFLCPLVIYSSSMYLIFDTIEVLFLALCILAMIRDRPFIAGAMMLMAGMVKPFAFYLVPLILAYFLLGKSDLRGKVNSFALTVGGFAGAFMIIFLPVLLNGEFSDALTFLTGRIESAEDAAEGGSEYVLHLITSFSSQIFIWLQPVIIAVALIFAGKYYRDGTRDLDKFVKYAVITMIAVFLWPVSQQCYYLVLVMLIAMMLPRWGTKTSMAIMFAISIPSVAYLLLSHNFSLLMPLSVYTDLISPDWVIDHLLSFNLSTDILGGYTYDSSRQVVQVIIMAMMMAVVYYLYRRDEAREKARGRHRHRRRRCGGAAGRRVHRLRSRHVRLRLGDYIG